MKGLRIISDRTSRKRVKYPKKILPQKHYRRKLELNNIFAREYFIVRRSNFEYKRTYNSLGFLREDAVTPKEIPGMSLNLLGGKWVLNHLQYSPTKDATKEWCGKQKVRLSDFKKNFKCIPGAPIVISTNRLHNKHVPYESEANKQVTNNIKKIFPENPPLSENGVFKFTGKMVLEHKATLLNYWHIQLEIDDFLNGRLKGSNRNEFANTAANYVIKNIFCMYSKSSIEGGYNSIHRRRFMR